MKRVRFWVGIAISIVALAFAFRKVDFGGVWTALVEANFWLLASSVVLLLAGLVLRTLRWRLLFHPQQGLRLRNLFAVINIGYLLSNIFPARLGDVARAYLIGDVERVSRAAAFSTVVAERVLDALCAVVGFFLVLLIVGSSEPPLADLPDWMVRSGLFVGAAALLAILGFVILAHRKEWTLRVLDRLLHAIHWPDSEAVAGFWARAAQRTRLGFLARMPWADRERLSKLAGSLIDGLSGVTTLRLGPPLLFWSVLIWSAIGGFYWLVLFAFDPSQPYLAGVAVSSVTALGMTVPSSPGYLGVFEVLARETMVLFGMEPEPALSYALVAHALVYVVFTLMGLLSMVQQNLSYAEIQRRISAEAQTSR